MSADRSARPAAAEAEYIVEQAANIAAQVARTEEQAVRAEEAVGEQPPAEAVEAVLTPQYFRTADKKKSLQQPDFRISHRT